MILVLLLPRYGTPKYPETPLILQRVLEELLQRKS